MTQKLNPLPRRTSYYVKLEMLYYGERRIRFLWQYHSPSESRVHCVSENIDRAEIPGSTSVPFQKSNLSGELNSLKISVIVLCSTFTTLLTYSTYLHSIRYLFTNMPNKFLKIRYKDHNLPECALGYKKMDQKMVKNFSTK